jgi:ABC-type glycerol-3-phosphate transport system permease component
MRKQSNRQSSDRPLRYDRQSWRGPQPILHIIIITLLTLSMFPIYLMIVGSFKNPIQYIGQRWVPTFPLRQGNYGAAWDVVQPYMLNTMFVAGVGLAGVLIMSLIGGHVFARMRFPLKGPLYFMIVVLLAVPWVLSFIPSYMLFNSLHLLNTPWVLIIPNLANGPVFGIFLMRAFIEGIPEELYEAARCDGASLFREMVSITLPLSLPGLATLSIVNFVGTWNWFLWPLVTITDKSHQLISVGLFQLTVGDFSGTTSFGPLMAGYVISSVPLVILFIFLGRFYVEGLTTSGLKV